MRGGARFCAVVLAVLAWAGPVHAQAPKPQDALAPEEYVRRTAVLDLLTIQSSQLAARKAQSADVRAFAEAMVAEHQQSNEGLKRAVDAANLEVSVPNSLDPQSLAAIDTLRKAAPAEFDRRYIETQLRSYREVLRLHLQYAKTGDIAPLKQFADTAAPVTEKHLTMAEKLPKGGR
jgi:putative membrane protein